MKKNLIRLIYILFDDDRTIVTSETERIRKGDIDHSLLCSIEREVQVVVNIFVQIVIGMIDSWRNNIILYSLDADKGLNCSCSSEQMTSHRLGRADIELVSMIAKDLLDSESL